MTEKGLSVPVLYSVLLVGDSDGEIPKTMAARVVSATTSCLAISALPDMDGETRIRLIENPVESTRILHGLLAFDGILSIASGNLTVSGVLGEVYLECTLTEPEVRIRVWVNDENTPDDIAVVVG